MALDTKSRARAPRWIFLVNVYSTLEESPGSQRVFNEIAFCGDRKKKISKWTTSVFDEASREAAEDTACCRCQITRNKKLFEESTELMPSQKAFTLFRCGFNPPALRWEYDYCAPERVTFPPREREETGIEQILYRSWCSRRAGLDARSQSIIFSLSNSGWRRGHPLAHRTPSLSVKDVCSDFLLVPGRKIPLHREASQGPLEYIYFTGAAPAREGK